MEEQPSSERVAGDGPPPRSSERKVAANRRNAKKSTGAKTAAGKARVARNALKHGLSAARMILIDGEDAEEYAALVRDLHQHWQPADPIEQETVNELAATMWMCRRVQRCAAGLARRDVADLRRRAERRRDDLVEEASALPDIPTRVRALLQTSEGAARLAEQVRAITAVVRAGQNISNEDRTLVNACAAQEVVGVDDGQEPEKLVAHLDDTVALLGDLAKELSEQEARDWQAEMMAVALPSGAAAKTLIRFDRLYEGKTDRLIRRLKKNRAVDDH